MSWRTLQDYTEKYGKFSDSEARELIEKVNQKAIKAGKEGFDVNRVLQWFLTEQNIAPSGNVIILDDCYLFFGILVVPWYQPSKAILAEQALWRIAPGGSKNPIPALQEFAKSIGATNIELGTRFAADTPLSKLYGKAGGKVQAVSLTWEI